MVEKETKRLRIYIGETDHYQGVVKKAQQLGIGGATVYKAIMGYGKNKRGIRTSNILELSGDLPIIIEIIDDKEKIELLLPHLQEFFKKGLITIEDVEVMMYGSEVSGSFNEIVQADPNTKGDH